jgi:hypothetical protein
MSKTRSIAVLGVLLAFAGCGDEDASSRVVFGSSGILAGAQVATWARILNGSERLAEIGVTIPMAAIREAKTAEDIEVLFPAEARAASSFNHLGIDYNPMGHGPAPFMVPHFDVHFYTIDQVTQKSIDCVDEPMPPAGNLPEPYVIPDTGTEPNGTCVPEMGVHAIKPTTFAGDYVFENELILGYHMGRIAFIEPMVTQSVLKQRMDFTVTVPIPKNRETPWPTLYTATYVPAEDAYKLVLSGFVGNEDVPTYD